MPACAASQSEVSASAHRASATCDSFTSRTASGSMSTPNAAASPPSRRTASTAAARNRPSPQAGSRIRNVRWCLAPTNTSSITEATTASIRCSGVNQAPRRLRSLSGVTIPEGYDAPVAVYSPGRGRSLAVRVPPSRVRHRLTTHLVRPRGLGRPACRHAAHAARSRARPTARHQRTHRSRRGRCGVPAAQSAAEPLRQCDPEPAQGDRHLPRRRRAEGALRHRRRRFGGRREEHVRTHPPGALGAVAGPPEGRPDHHRRVPVPEPGPRRARDHAPQGVPRVLRHT